MTKAKMIHELMQNHPKSSPNILKFYKQLSVKQVKKHYLRMKLTYAIKNCYSLDVLEDLSEMFIEFDSNSFTSSLKEFLKK